MTWEEYEQKKAEELAYCKNAEEFGEKLDEIDKFLGENKVPTDFWDELRARYQKAPKRILKDTTAAAALNRLLTAAETLIAARSAKK